MNRLESAILQAVAYQATVLFVPPQLAGINVAVNMSLLMTAVAVFDFNPLLFMITLIVGHIALIVASVREAHLVTLLQAIGQKKHSSKNIISSEGVKYVP